MLGSDFNTEQVEGMIHQDLLPECPPTKFNPMNLEEARRHPDTVQRYYVSQLMDLDPSENPPFELLLSKDGENDTTTSELISHFSKEEKEKLAKMADIVNRLLLGRDICDKVGVLYVAKIFALSQHNNASILLKDLVDEWDKSQRKEIITVAKKLIS